MASARILIVTPYAAVANNGNVRTAQRWANLLQPRHPVVVRTPADAPVDADLLIALHARRSHCVLRAWREHRRARPCVLALTGTDLYQDLPSHDTDALESLELADRLIVLQARGPDALPEQHRSKARVIYQSSPPLPVYVKSNRHLRVLFVGHLREVKDPFTFIRAAACVRDRSSIEFAVVGGLRDPALADPLRELLRAAPNVRMLGALSHAATRQRIRRAHLLVVPSRLEGGANVIVEAVTAGTAVLASNCEGNLGMLGADYAGLFPVGDPRALAHLIERYRAQPALQRQLHELCIARAPLFSPSAEARALQRLVDDLLTATA